METVDLRSDILTPPTAPVIDAMNEAARAPAEFGLREDPYVRALEARVADHDVADTDVTRAIEAFSSVATAA